ncbi:MAG TPA: arsenate reductase ArsC [Bryobacteraceae bacterium]|jgi:arsenate reductase|nr:arsenate reductase ArsC [Bryobacteraceae bacterium]
MRGDNTPKPRTEKAKKRVLFVCIGNACRSQMAEAFARAYGSDILIAKSAGLAPAGALPPLTRQTLSEKQISTDGQFPKNLESFVGQPFDVVVNLSGESLPAAFGAARLLEWSVRDPIGENQSVYRAVAGQIESLVMRLIIELREK